MSNPPPVQSEAGLIAAGTRVGSFEVQALHGRGTMGKGYLALALRAVTGEPPRRFLTRLVTAEGSIDTRSKTDRAAFPAPRPTE